MQDEIVIRGAKEHNLKNIDLTLPRNKFIVFTGLSGSGKSTLAFDTIYAEGQRRYLESLSSYARQFLGQMEKPNVESIEGLSPAISIDQKAASHNPRSTVGTVTEVYDYLRVLYARIGIPHCPVCGKPIQKLSVEQMIEKVLDLAPTIDMSESRPNGVGSDKKIQILAPVVRGRKGEYLQLLNDLYKKGYAEARINGKIQKLDSPIKLARYKNQTIEVVVDSLTISSDNLSRITESIETALKLAEGLLLVVSEDKSELLLNQKLSCPEHGGEFPEIEPRIFSFNSPFGACQTCDGLGTKKDIDINLVVPDKSLSVSQGAILPLNYKSTNYYGSVLRAALERYGFSEHAPLTNLSDEYYKEIMFGGAPQTLQIRYFTHGRVSSFNVKFDGIIPLMERRYRQTESEGVRSDIEKYMSQSPCPTCLGKRLKPEVLLIKISDQNISEVTALSIKDSYEWFLNLKLTSREMMIAERILNEIKNRLKFLLDVGLNYLTLDRTAYTLAGGESQRIRLASQIGSGLVGVLYILDEPSIGLHSRDNARLLETLKHLRDLGNTVIAVEHDEETMREADYVVDIGPGAGRFGGEIVAQGSIENIINEPRSITGQYLSGVKKIEIPSLRRKINPPKSGKFLTVIGANENNLKNLTVHIPLGVFTCVTGVSGSGKSTLVNEIIYKALSRKLMKSLERPGKFAKIEGVENLNKVIDINQSPIGRTPRSNPATYTGVFTAVRELFAQTKDAKMRGYMPGRFSFNVSGGRCDNCQGDGIIKIEMHFMPDIFIPCEVCGGKRFNRETLEVRYKGPSLINGRAEAGKNIADILDMTVQDAWEFFKDIPKIADVLKTLNDVGLGYIKMGQSATTLSGGEAQRVKLATELARRATGTTLYILDEPTTGLHFEDINKLLEVLHRLVAAGNSVIVIEHNLDVVKTADYIIDLGPEGGDLGGTLIGTGSPEDIAKLEKSYTGQFLAPILKKAPNAKNWL